MNKKLTIIIFILSLNTTYSQTNFTKKIDSLMHQANDLGIFNGRVLVVKNCGIIYDAAIGFSDTNKNLLHKNSTMPVGSIAKEFNAVGIMMLAEQSKLSIEDTITKYISNLPNYAKRIKIKHLLNYTSGLPRHNKNLSYQSGMQKIKDLKELEFNPGTGYSYSYFNVILQIKIIENITGLTYKNFLQNYIFKPYKIKGGEVIKNNELKPNMAHSFDNDFNETTFEHGGNSMYFSLGDLYNWVKALHHTEMISNESKKILSRSFNKDSESSLGFIKVVNGEIAAQSHHGSGDNYEAVIYVDNVNEIEIILMSNNQNFKLWQLKDAIVNILNKKNFELPKKSIYLDIRGKLLDNFSNGISFYNNLKENHSKVYDMDSEVYDLYSTGNYLMRRERFEDAIKIFHISASTEFQDKGGISYSYSLIGDCYRMMNDYSMAIIYYKKAIELEPKNKALKAKLKTVLSKIESVGQKGN